MSTLAENKKSAESIVNTAIDNTKVAINDGMDVAKDVVGGGVDSAKEAITGGIDKAKQLVVDGYDKVSETAHEVWDKAADTSVHDVQATVVKFIRHNPGKSLLIGAGIGLVLGIILRSRVG